MTSDSHTRLMREISLIFRRTTIIIQYPPLRWEYCTFSQVLIPKSDNNLMSLNISQQTATEVINTCIRLREDKPFNQIIQEVVEDIRTICDADYCSVLLLDENERKCTLLGEANVPDSGLATMQKYLDDDFFDLAMTWQDTMAGSYCLVIRDANDMEFIRLRTR